MGSRYILPYFQGHELRRRASETPSRSSTRRCSSIWASAASRWPASARRSGHLKGLRGGGEECERVLETTKRRLEDTARQKAIEDERKARRVESS